ncbi:MAG: aminotransferase class I/II-fold pyridoxal phosphate-dependent enzyme [Pseudomonadota bacterium]
MQVPERFSDLPEYAFPRLRALLDPIPAGGPPIAMSLGEPSHPFPDFVTDAILARAAGFNRYPPNEGTADLRAAIADWVKLRYGASLDPEAHILPLNGTREGLFNACLALSPEAKNGGTPAVLLPNPFYQCYAAAARAAGAEPIYVPATAGTDFLPDFAALPADLLARTTVVYMCSPSNPQGAVADESYWRTLIGLAETHDFRIFADECYCEIYRDAAPTGALEVARAMDADPERVLIFHSLSKRSNLPGLRSGFAAGGSQAIAALLRLRAYAGAPLPLPLQHAAMACWRDEAHVEANRALYREKYAIADQTLGDLAGYRPPQAGFFVWLPVADGEEAAKTLWREAGVRALPGAYLSRPTPAELGGGDPGQGYLRLALVAPADEVRQGLAAVREIMAKTPATAG